MKNFEIFISNTHDRRARTQAERCLRFRAKKASTMVEVSRLRPHTHQHDAASGLNAAAELSRARDGH